MVTLPGPPASGRIREEPWSAIPRKAERQANMELSISVQIWKKEKWYVAKCPELDFVSQGRDRDEARSNLLEVVEIQLEEMGELGTLDDYLSECGYVHEEERFVPHIEMVGFEKQSVQVA